MYLDTDGFYHKFDVSGHADGYRDDSEYDLVCAAISSITLTIASGLQDVLDEDFAAWFGNHSNYVSRQTKTGK